MKNGTIQTPAADALSHHGFESWTEQTVVEQQLISASVVPLVPPADPPEFVNNVRLMTSENN